MVERESIEVDWCPDCHGIWFDAGELELLAGKAGRELPPGALGREPAQAPREKRRRCPRCRRKMRKAETGAEPPVLIDRCDAHGVWLDAGELGALMRELAPAGSAVDPVASFLGESFQHASASRGQADRR